MKKFFSILICFFVIMTFHSFAQTSVGGMGGQFAVSPMGGAMYSIPIEVPQGVSGLQPQLSIVYNSQSGNGLCGYGASLAGLSSITRGPKDIYHDGTAQGMKYQADDALYLDGVRLILSSGTAGQDGAVYHPESNPFTTVTVNGNCTSSSNNIWFEVHGSDGLVYEYGHAADSRLSYNVGSSQRIHSWYINRVQQPTGNYMTYHYQTSNYCVYPVQIKYGGAYGNGTQLNTVTLNYESRSDSVLLRFDGKKGRMNMRLSNITSKTSATTFREYVLNYDTISDGTSYKFSRLTSVTEQNGQNNSLPATQLEWSHLPAVTYSAINLDSNFNELSSPTVSIDNQKFGSCDLNGDGIDDIIGYGKTNSTNDRKIYVYKYLSSRTNNGVSFAVDHQYSFTTSYSEVSGDVSDELIQELKSSTLGGSAVIDYDGDGRNEYLIGRIFKTYDMNANGSFTLNKYMEFFMLREEDSYNYSRTRLITDCTPLYSTGDIDNDGRSDLIILETQSYDDIFVKLHILSASVDSAEYTYDYANLPVSNSVDYDLHLPYTPRQLFVADMNGNGLQDLLVIYANGYSVFWNRGGNITGSNLMYNGNVSDYVHYGQGLNNYYAIAPGDFNGDGLIDFLTKESQYWCFNLNKGDGSFYKTNCTSSLLNTSVSNSHCDIIDFDHDGKSDAIITETTHYPMMSAPYYKTYTRWMRSTGTFLEQVYCATSNRQDDALSTRYITGDFNGDGMSELINYGYDCVYGNNANTDPVWRIYKNSNLTAQSGKVTSVTGDFGATTSITYSTLASPNVYTRGTSEPYPAPRYTIPLNVVSQTVQNNGAAGSLTTQYAYEGLRAHLQGKGLLGFSKTTASCTTTSVNIGSGITEWDTTHYIPKVTYTRTTIGNNSSQTVDSLSIVDTYLTNSNRLYFAYPSQTVATDMDNNVISTYRTYNTAKGYITSDSTAYSTDMYRSVSYRDYTLNKVGGSYRPQTIVQSQRHHDDTAPFSTTTTYTYNNTTGTVATKTDNYGTSKPLTTSYTYDSWGNLTSRVSTGSGITSCTTLYEYDASHRFPVRVYTNLASSVQKYTYDLWGNLLTEQDSINATVHNTTTYSYDSWGNLVGTVYPDGTSTTYTRGWSSDVAQRWFVLEQGTARPWVKTWYDNRGREVLTESKGPMDVDITATTTYNAKGQVISRTETSGDLSLTHSYTYDPRGRISGESAPGGRSVTYQYGNRSVTVTENSSRITVKTYDAWGNLKTLTDPVSGITNTYSSTGGIKQTSSGGATWTFGYDNRGNRTSMTDPDAGTTTYVYDALGRETQRTDARGVAFVTTYDYLGRVTQRKADSETITYNYGLNGNGQLKLASESYDGWTRSYSYDNLGRVTGETMSNGTITKSRSYTYGPDGMLATRTLPGDKTYSYSYDSYGNLTGVDAASGALRWDLTGYTGKRTTSSTVLGNSAYYTFNKATVLDQYGYLDSLITDKNGIRYQCYDYGFSPLTGNLTRLDANWMDYPRTFQYDSADRLIRVQENNQDILYMTYAQNGNILSKSGIGYYEYGSTQKPHAVTAVDNFDGWIDDSIQYISYNSWGKLEDLFSVRDGDVYHYSIEYGPDLQRVRSSLYRNGQPLYSKFYWDDYEEKTENNTTYLYWYVNGGDGLAGIMLGNAQNGSWSLNLVAITDHLGSIMALMDNYDTYYSCSYDAWGNRTIGMESPWGIDRGFCGHEHIDEIGLINMNGRMYDPKLSRFLSPDNYIQSPYNPQNFNRYSYCLNNPLKYTDSDGEFWEMVFFDPVTFGLGNTLAHLIRGDIKSFGDGCNYFGQGFLTGSALSATWALAPCIPFVGDAFQAYMSGNAYLSISMMALGTTSGLARGLIKGDWSTLTNSLEMMLGNYYIDENADFGEGIGQAYSRHTWESLQTTIGHGYSQARNLAWQVDRVDFMAGATYATTENMSFQNGVTLGNYINVNIEDEISGDFDDWVLTHPLFMHEYGHTIDSRGYGPSYLFTIGWSSLNSARTGYDLGGRNTHKWHWTELRANNNASRYFQEHYPSVNWSNYIDFDKGYYFPLEAPVFTRRKYHSLFHKKVYEVH